MKFGNMSRIGKQPIIIPKGVDVAINSQEVKIKGAKGSFSYVVPEEISVKKEENKIVVSVKSQTKRSSALWGLVRALLNNYVIGVTEGFEKKLEIIGIGYKAALSDNGLEIKAGFSHPVFVDIPEDLNVSVEKNIITIKGADKQRVGNFAAKIRRIRPPEPYKGKGIRYLGEKVRMKEGKKAGAAK